MKMSFDHIKKIFNPKNGFLLFILLTLLFFQNCSQYGVYLQNKDDLKKISFAGNGGSYEGKITKNYYRMTPEFTCSNKEAPLSWIEVNDSSLILTENKTLQCSHQSNALNLSLVDQSIYQTQIIGFQEGIFENLLTNPITTPSNLVEVWCRDRKDRQGIEVIVYFDHLKKQAIRKIYYSDLNKDGIDQTIKLSEANTNRLLTENTVIIRDEENFHLIVHRDQSSTDFGLFDAEMKILIENQIFSRKTTCRLGGSLDPKVWPSKQIVDLSINDFKLSNNLEYFAYSSSAITGIPNLFLSKSDGTSQKQIATPMLQTGISSSSLSSGRFEFDKSSQYLIYSGDTRIADTQELFSLKIASAETIQLSEKLSINYQSVLNDFQFSSDGQTIIYRDGYASGKTDTKNQKKWLKASAIHSDKPVLLNPPFPLGFDMGVHKFAISPTESFVAYFGGPIFSDLYSASFDGTKIIKITPSMIPARSPIDTHLELIKKGEWYFPWSGNIVIPPHSTMILAEAQIWGATDTKVLAISIDGSQVFEFPINQQWSILSPSGKHAVFIDKNSKKKTLYNLNSKDSIEIPTLNNLFFSKNSHQLIGSRLNINGQTELISVDTNDHTVNSLCPEAQESSLILVDELSPSHFYLASANEKRNEIWIHVKDPSKSCRFLAKVPLNHSQSLKLEKMTLSPDQEKMLLKIKTEEKDSLIFIPFNGFAPMLINTPLIEDSKISQFHFLSDSRTILFVGNQIKPDEPNAFLWTSPY